MKKQINRLTALLTAALTSVSTISVFRSEMVTAVEKNILPVTEMNSSSAEAADGEAIVMYRGTSALRTAQLPNTLNGIAEVVQSYTFDTAEDTALQSSSSYSTTVKKGFSISLVKSDTLSTEKLIKQLKTQLNVVYAEPNYRIKAASYEEDPYAEYQWALENMGQNGGVAGNSIHADTTYLQPDADAGEQVIALVDTGIDYTHPDLAEHVWENPYAETGQLNGAHGFDFINKDDDPMDDNGHGTHCSGIMAASVGNGIGIAGTASAEQVKIMGLKILDADGYGYGMEAIGAYHYIYQAQQSGVNVVAVNNSWGGMSSEDENILKTLIDMVGTQGAVSICAAGNESNDNDEMSSMPSGLDSSYVISVAASNEKDELASFSNYGKSSVDLAAPGTNILSTVSYSVMNPTFYTDAQKETLLYFYDDFSDRALVASPDAGVIVNETSDTQLSYAIEKSDEIAEVTVSKDEAVYFGTAADNASSLSFSIQGAAAGSDYTLYIPYLAQGGETAAKFSSAIQLSAPTMENTENVEDASTLFISDSTVSADGVYDESGETVYAGTYLTDNNNYWNTICADVPVTKEGTLCAIAFQVHCAVEGDYAVHLDNLAISDVDAPEEELLQNYDYYNGTSMATPYVTGAMAALAAANPTMTAEERTALLLGCTRKSDALEGVVQTGGVLDLSYLENPNPTMTDATIDAEQGILLVTGNQLSAAQITINGEAAKLLQSDDMTAEIDVSSYQKKKINLSVQYENANFTKNFYYAAGNEPDQIEYSDSNIMNDAGELLSIDKTLYYCSEIGAVYQYDTTNDGIWNQLTMDFSTGGFISEMESIGSDVQYTATRFVVAEDNIYTMVHIDLSYMQKNVLAVYDFALGSWKAVAESPSTFTPYVNSALAYYDGSIYLMGGIHSLTGAYQADLTAYSLEEQEWQTKPSLPAGAFGGHGVQVGEKLYLTLQSTEDDTANTLWVYDGSAWSVCDSKIPQMVEDYMYFDASVSVYQDELIYTGLPVQDLGDIFKYQTQEDVFVGSDYSMYDYAKDDIYASTVSGNVLYVMYTVDNGVALAKIPLNGSLVGVDTGDVDQDGAITIHDAFLVLLYSSQLAVGQNDALFTDGTDPDLEAAVVDAADVDQDGTITMRDAFYILMYSSKASIGEDVTWEELLG